MFGHPNSWQNIPFIIKASHCVQRIRAALAFAIGCPLSQPNASVQRQDTFGNLDAGNGLEIARFGEDFCPRRFVVKVVFRARLVTCPSEARNLYIVTSERQSFLRLICVTVFLLQIEFQTLGQVKSMTYGRPTCTLSVLMLARDIILWQSLTRLPEPKPRIGLLRAIARNSLRALTTRAA